MLEDAFADNATTTDYRNHVQSVLYEDVTNTADAVRIVNAVSPYQDPPASGYMILTDSLFEPTKLEIIRYTSITNALPDSYIKLNGVVRGLGGTSATNFDIGSPTFQVGFAEGLVDTVPITDEVVSALSYIVFANAATGEQALHSNASIIFDAMNGILSILHLVLAGNLVTAGQLQIEGGSPGEGKVLTSDGVGLATWKTPVASGGGDGILGYATLSSSSNELTVVWDYDLAVRDVLMVLNAHLDFTADGTQMVYMEIGTAKNATDDITWQSNGYSQHACIGSYESDAYTAKVIDNGSKFELAANESFAVKDDSCISAVLNLMTQPITSSRAHLHVLGNITSNPKYEANATAIAGGAFTGGMYFQGLSGNQIRGIRITGTGSGFKGYSYAPSYLAVYDKTFRL